MAAGQDFVKKIRPIGSAMFLLLFVLFLIVCFTSGKKPLPGYENPHDSTYYSQNDTTLSELKAELEANVFPKLEGAESCTVSGGRLLVTIDGEHYSETRSAILKFYDESLFEFVEG